MTITSLRIALDSMRMEMSRANASRIGLSICAGFELNIRVSGRSDYLTRSFATMWDTVLK